MVEEQHVPKIEEMDVNMRGETQNPSIEKNPMQQLGLGAQQYMDE
jgi:hypothetical protein